jgi:hypothetical protein
MQFFWQAQMLILIILAAVFAVLSGLIVFLTYRLTRMKETVVAAKLTASRAQARQTAATQEARKAEQQCLLLLGQVETSLAHTGQALEVAGTIKQVSRQIQGLIDHIAAPVEALAPSSDYRPGRHALSPSAPQAITGSHDMSSSEHPEFTP